MKEKDAYYKKSMEKYAEDLSLEKENHVKNIDYLDSEIKYLMKKKKLTEEALEICEARLIDAIKEIGRL